MKILVVDDDVSIREIIGAGLSERGFSVEIAADGAEALEKIERDLFDLVLTDLMMPQMDGIELINKIKELQPDLLILLMTAYGSFDSAVQAIKIGANDYLAKPIDFQDLLLRIDRVQRERDLLQQNQLLKLEVRKKFEFHNILGKSRKMQEVFSLIEKVASSNSTVLIYGSSGTGKELVAKAIHYNSPRTNSPFIPFNSGAIPETLVESELFGYIRGAFTGAIHAKRGLFEEANRGTLFLDEISTIHPMVQVKLLRVLQEKELMRLGSNERIKVDVRLIAATNENLESQMKEGKFREDLFYRLHVFPIYLPDLKDRKEDIPLLANHFLHIYAEENRKKIKAISKEGMNLLIDFHWPGNVRELENAIQRAVLLADHQFLTPSDFPEPLRERSGLLIRQGINEKKSLEEIKNEYILEVLKTVDGNRKKAAEILKVHPKTLYRLDPKKTS